MLLWMSTIGFAARPPGLDRAVEPEAVTVERWTPCVEAGACAPHQSTAEGRRGATLVQVPFEEADAFCRWQGRWLPTPEDIEVLGIKVPAHLPTKIGEWVGGPGGPWVRAPGSRELEPGAQGQLHGVRCLWSVEPAPAPPLPPFESCLQGYRRLGEPGTTEARAASDEESWTCAGLSVWLEMPPAGPTWLDHWTGESQTVVAERSDGSYALVFRRQQPDTDGEDAWFLPSITGDAGIKRIGPIRRTPLRDLEPGRRASYRVRIPGQREGRIEAMWLTHAGWDLAMVVGPGQYGARADEEDATAFFRTIAPSLVPGWSLPLPGGGWAALPSSLWSPIAPRLRPDRVVLAFESIPDGDQLELEVTREPLGGCDPAPDVPDSWALRSLGEVEAPGWVATFHKSAGDDGAIRWIVSGCSSLARVQLEIMGPAELTQEALSAWAQRFVFPEAEPPR